MKILTISEVYPDESKPQYGIYIKQQVDRLISLGNEIDVLLPRRTSTNSNIKQSEWEGVRVYSMDYRTIRYELFPSLIARGAYLSIKDLVRQNKYDLIAVHITSDTILKIATDVANELGIKVVAHYHGLNVWSEHVSRHKLRDKWYANRRANILRKTNAIVGVSDKVCEIVRQKVDKVPVHTVYNGVETELFYPQDCKFDNFTVIGVGNLISIKGFRYLIDAFKKLYDEDSTVRLVIVGEGVERNSLLAKISSLGLDEAVTLTGKLPYDEVSQYMRRSHVFVLPSYYEALGCVYLEAMACGVPTVGVNGMGIDEIIVDGQNGYLCNPRDVDSVYDCIKKVMTSTDFQADLGMRGRETALKFTWEASAKSLDEVYKSVVR